MTTEWQAPGLQIIKRSQLASRNLTVVTTRMIEGNLFKNYPFTVDLVDEHARVLVRFRICDRGGGAVAPSSVSQGGAFMTKHRRPTKKERPKPKFRRRVRLPNLQNEVEDEHERAAIARARAALREIRDNRQDFLNMGIEVYMFDKDDQERHVVAVMKNLALATPEGMLSVFNLATVARWRLAFDAMCELHTHFEHFKWDKPPPLATFSELLARQASRSAPPIQFDGGREKTGFIIAGFGLACVVADVNMAFGYKATRNHAYPHWPCGCSVTAKAATAEHLPYTEDTIIRAWEFWHKRMGFGRPKFLPKL